MFVGPLHCTRDTTEVVSQFTLTQGSGCSYLYRHYNNLPIVVTLYNTYSTLNITADNQLQGITVECVLVSSTVERANMPIQITRESRTLVVQCMYYNHDISSLLSIILSYNTNYTLEVMVDNCAGHSKVSSTLDVFL